MINIRILLYAIVFSTWIITSFYWVSDDKPNPNFIDSNRDNQGANPNRLNIAQVALRKKMYNRYLHFSSSNTGFPYVSIANFNHQTNDYYCTGTIVDILENWPRNNIGINQGVPVQYMPNSKQVHWCNNSNNPNRIQKWKNFIWLNRWTARDYG